MGKHFTFLHGERFKALRINIDIAGSKPRQQDIQRSPLRIFTENAPLLNKIIWQKINISSLNIFYIHFSIFLLKSKRVRILIFCKKKKL